MCNLKCATRTFSKRWWEIVDWSIVALPIDHPDRIEMEQKGADLLNEVAERFDVDPTNIEWLMDRWMTKESEAIDRAIAYSDNPLRYYA